MKKIPFLGVVLTVLVGLAPLSAEVNWKSYSPAFPEKSLAIQAGIGLGYVMPGTVSIPPLGLSVDYALPLWKLPFSLGGYIGYAYSEDKNSLGSYTWAYQYTYYIVGARMAYHVDFGIKKLDSYAGAMLGWDVASVNTSGNAITGSVASAGGLSLGLYVGARYFFTPNWAAFAELGYSVGVLNLGSAYKF